MDNMQKQTAGDNSQQVQMINPVINMGIDEKRAREIFTEMSQMAIAENSAEAIEIAKQRIKQFEDQLIPRIQQIEENFDSFSDPTFQVLLRKAQLTAACAERENDYKVLSELLVHRVKNKTNIKKKASITKAVEIVDQIDDDSLCALTVFLAVSSFIPLSGQISEGLNVLSGLYEKLNLDKLPYDALWLDNLSILGAINITPFTSLSKYTEVLSNSLPGYVCAGIKKDSEEYESASNLLKGCGIGSNFLIENELLSGYVRLPLRNKNHIDDLVRQKQIINNGSIEFIQIPLTKAQKECIASIFDLYIKDNVVISQVKDNFQLLLDSYPAIKKVGKWWDSLQGGISLTSVGKVIAHTNAKSFDSTLPDLD